MNETVITIDGPSASGKSTVAKRLAKALGYFYVDSGALYRAVTWRCLESACPFDDTTAIIQRLNRLSMEFYVNEQAVMFKVDGMIPGDAIRTQVVNNTVSLVARVPDVRQQVNTWLRSMTQLGALVVEGRDIGSVVFPNATHKFYLDASPEERAKRRHKELNSRDPSVQVTEVESSLARRDKLDTTRQADPLRIPDGANVIDSTGLNLDQVVDVILKHIPSR